MKSAATTVIGMVVIAFAGVVELAGVTPGAPAG